MAVMGIVGWLVVAVVAIGLAAWGTRVPAAYWRLWSDMILHRIHRRVLDQIKQNAERDTARPPPGAAAALSFPALVEADAAKALQ